MGVPNHKRSAHELKIDWKQVGELIEDAYRLAAPKKLLKQLDGE